MPMSYSARLKIPIPDENDKPDIPSAWTARTTILDGLAPIDTGPLSSEQPSTAGAPGIRGRFFVVTDQADSPRLDLDYGTGYVTVGPAPADGPANIPSRRTIGTGALQACAGNDPRLVGGAAASGDVNGTYPGPLTIVSWGGQTKGQVVASVPPQSHANSHNPGGGDPVNGLTDASMAASVKDGTAATPSLRTLGPGAQQAAPGNDARFGYTNAPGDLIFSAAANRAGCLPCDGSAVSRTTYAALFTAIGTTYGAGNGSSTFNVPDYQGRTIIGAGAGAGLTARARGAKVGSETHTHPQPGLGVPALAASVTVPNHAHGMASAHAPLWVGSFGGSLVIQTKDVAGGDGGLAQFTAALGSQSSGLTGNGVLPIYGTTDGSGNFGANGQTAAGATNAGATSAGGDVTPAAVCNVFIVY